MSTLTTSNTGSVQLDQTISDVTNPYMHYNYPAFQTESFFEDSTSFKILKNRFMSFLSDTDLPELSEDEQDKILNLLISPDIESVCLGMDMLEEKRLRRSIKAWIIVDEAFTKYYYYWKEKMRNINK